MLVLKMGVKTREKKSERMFKPILHHTLGLHFGNVCEQKHEKIVIKTQTHIFTQTIV